MSNLNVISNWYGRLGNNIQQICNGILHSEVTGQGFFTPDHELINRVMVNYKEQQMLNPPNRYFHYKTHNKDFDIDLGFLFSNMRRVAIQHIAPNFKFSVGTPFDEDTIVIHVRSGDLFAVEHNPPHDYIPNPLIYYKNLIESHEKAIVVTENDNYNPIIPELKKYDNTTVQSSTVARDFATLMRAKNLASSGAGTFAVAAALCSSNIKNFYCSNIYLTEHLNPEMLIASGINVLMMKFKGYLESKSWKNDEEQRKFILEYFNESIWC
tara:strand:+ start:87 stop:890 length:804 start_codon:yes stop_codon:yes gene_type:complete